MTRAEAWHRRHAIQPAAQLPKGKEDALLVLKAAKQLAGLAGFWEVLESTGKASVVAIKGGKAFD